MLKPDIFSLVFRTDSPMTIISLLPVEMKAVLFVPKFCHN